MKKHQSVKKKKKVHHADEAKLSYKAGKKIEVIKKNGSVKIRTAKNDQGWRQRLR